MSMVKNAVNIMIALVVIGALASVAFSAIEDWTPTDPTVLAIKPLLMIFAIIGISLAFVGPILRSRA